MPVPDAVAGDILLAEFGYAQAAALQANEDRARASSYFLATAGSVMLALLGLKLDPVPHPLLTLGFAALFTALTVIGFTTLNQLAGLRLAWLEACRAMNHIKDRYVRMYPALDGAFRWTDATLPPAFKPTSIGSHLARLLATVIGLAAASTTIFVLWTAWVLRMAAPADAVAQTLAAVASGLVGLTLGAIAWQRYVQLLRQADESDEVRQRQTIGSHSR
jgi:hypothetical protein